MITLALNILAFVVIAVTLLFILNAAASILAALLPTPAHKPKPLVAKPPTHKVDPIYGLSDMTIAIRSAK